MLHATAPVREHADPVTPRTSPPDHHPDIRLLRISQLRGPNLWTFRPTLEVWLDLGPLEQWPSNRLPGFNARLTGLLPGLAEHHCGVGERGGFLQRLDEGTWAGHMLEHVIIELLNLAGLPTGFGQTRETSRRGIYRMVIRSRDEQVTRAALHAGHALLMAAINDRPHDVDASVARIREVLDRCWLGPSTQAIVAAATERGIPHLRLNDGNLVQLGQGARQRRIWTAETDLTSAIAEGISRDKSLTKQLLAACGLPVPEGQRVDSADEAWEAAQSIGLPVAVKPRDGNHARGVTLELRSREDIAAAYTLADEHGSAVMVERHIRGDEHRLLVVGGKVAAASRGESVWVTGDGHCTVATLIEQQVNSDPRRGDDENCPLSPVRLDDPEIPVALELARQGLHAESVPIAGRRVLILRTGNLGIDCTDEVHPEVAHAAALAARVVGLDIAGVDIVCEHIGRPLEAQGGAIVEVNAGPGLLMHLKPAVGQPRPVGRAIVDELFAEDDSGRIPVVGVAGARDTATVARLAAWLLHLGEPKVGLACADGLYVGERRMDRRASASFEAGERLLINREVKAAVIEAGARVDPRTRPALRPLRRRRGDRPRRHPASRRPRRARCRADGACTAYPGRRGAAGRPCGAQRRGRTHCRARRAVRRRRDRLCPRRLVPGAGGAPRRGRAGRLHARRPADARHRRAVARSRPDARRRGADDRARSRQRRLGARSVAGAHRDRPAHLFSDRDRCGQPRLNCLSPTCRTSPRPRP